MVITGRLTTCSQCGGALWLEDEQLEPISALLIGIVSCLRCGAAWICATPSGLTAQEDDDDAEDSADASADAGAGA